MSAIRLTTVLGLAAAIATSPANADAPAVVASIKPVHSLAAAVMDGVAAPTLLIEGAGSPHVHALRPSEARALQRAEVVFWIGEGLETFLDRPLATLAADARIVALIESDGLELLPAREGGGWDAHDHDRDHQRHVEAGLHDRHEADHHPQTEAGDHDHGHGDVDRHVWLDPRNAAAMARSIAAVLIEADPQNAPIYRSNLAGLEADLAALERTLGDRLEPVRERPFVVFHDAYQYFERRFDMNAVGSISVSPESQPGAARLRELRRAITTTQAHCVFSEPQFEPRLLETVTEGSDARSGVLDPLGAGLDAGPEQYFELMRAMADSLVDCLGGPEAG